MIMLKLYLKLCIKQNREQDLILTPKQMVLRLPIALEIRQIVYYLHQSNEISKNVYNNIIKSIQL